MESISVFFPAYNDSATIWGLVERTHLLLKETGRSFEIIVVDDGSTDDTPRVLGELEVRMAGTLRVIRHAVNSGYGAALRSGFAAANKDLVFYTDGDGQYDPAELSFLLAHLSPGIGLVNGYKIKRHDPYHRIVIGKIYNFFVRLVFRIRVKDVDCDFRLIRREYLSKVRLRSDTGAICVELLRELESLGCRSVDVPVHHFPRTAGNSQFFRLRSVFATLEQLASLFFRKPPVMESSPGELLETNPK